MLVSRRLGLGPGTPQTALRGRERRATFGSALREVRPPAGFWGRHRDFQKPALRRRRRFPPALVPRSGFGTPLRELAFNTAVTGTPTPRRDSPPRSARPGWLRSQKQILPQKACPQSSHPFGFSSKKSAHGQAISRSTLPLLRVNEQSPEFHGARALRHD